MADTMDQLRLLRNRMQAIGDELGLTLQGFMVIPSGDADSADLAQVMFVLRSEALTGNEDNDDALLRQQFDAIVSDFDGEERDDIDKLKDDVEKWLE